jgi:WD40 repeat protein
MSKRLGNTRKEQVSSSEAAFTSSNSPSLHRCRFFPYQPSAINQVVVTPSGCLPQVAVIRAAEPSFVEIYTPSSDWAVERIISAKAGENFECAVFVGPVEDDNEMEIDSEEDEVDISPAVAKNSKVVEAAAVADEAKYSQDTSKLNAKHFLPLEESLKYPRARLFTAGVDGRLREWSNEIDGQSTEIFSIDINGGAIWSLSVSPDQKTLAIGCEDGRIRLFSIYARSVEFLRGFEAVEGPSENSSVRILSLSWNPQGNTLISGAASGSIKIWNCQTGRPIHSIKMANISIWSVTFCDSQTFVSGDSKGQVQFWDALSGTLLQSFPAFGADVLSLTCLEERKVFATGVDHKIIEFVKVTAPNAVGHVADKWIQGAKRYFHTHDVRSITNLVIKYEKESKLYERLVLISGGVDCTLVVSDPEAFDRALERSKSFNSHQRRLLPFSRHSPMIQMAKNIPILAGKIGNSIQIWKLAESNDQKQSVHLAEIKISRHEAITAFSISPDANFVCVLTSSELRLFKLESKSSNVIKIDSIPAIKMAKKATFPHLATFSNESTLLLFNSKEIIKLTISETLEISQGDSFSLSFNPRRVVSNVSRDLLSLSTDRQVFLLSFSNGKKNSIKKVYESAYPITSVSFLDAKTVAISDCRNAIIKITGDIVNETYSELPKEWKVRKEPIMGIQSHPLNPNKISCWSDASISQIIFPATKRKLKSEESNELEIKLIDDYRPLLFFSHLPNCSDSVVIERPWISIVENFPPAFYRSRYGAQ